MILALRLFFCLLLIGAVPLAAADPGPMGLRTGEGAALLEQGRAQMIAFRLDAAERTFARLARAEPDNPAAANHLAKIAWWRAVALEQNELYDAFFERSDALIEVIDGRNDPWSNLFRGETELHRAAVHGQRGEYARGAMAMRRAYQHFRRNARDHPDFSESRWGMGICYVTVGSVPSSFRWVLRILGFRGTVTAGMEEIAATMRRSTYYRDEAAIFYGVIDEVINESRNGGLRHLHAVHARYPDSPLALYLRGFAHLHEREAAAAEEALRRASRALERPGVHTIPFVDYYLGDALFRQDKFEEAARYFERFLRDFPGTSQRAQAAVHAGLAREMMGDRRAAIRHYRSVTSREESEDDQSALREAEALLAAPMSAQQRSLLLGRTAFDGGRYPAAVRAVQPLLNDSRASPLERAEAAYRSGRAFQAMERWDEAIRHFQIAVSNPGDPLAKWGPWSQYYIGEVYAARGNREAARAAYRRALDYNQPFEYRKSLEQRTRAALERL